MVIALFLGLWLAGLIVLVDHVFVTRFLIGARCFKSRSVGVGRGRVAESGTNHPVANGQSEMSVRGVNKFGNVLSLSVYVSAFTAG